MSDRDDITRMAREANLLFPGVDTVDGSVEQLERFFHLAYAAGAAAEREACAKVCVADLIESPTKFEVAAINKCAAAIRARGQS